MSVLYRAQQLLFTTNRTRHFRPGAEQQGPHTAPALHAHSQSQRCVKAQFVVTGSLVATQLLCGVAALLFGLQRWWRVPGRCRPNWQGNLPIFHDHARQED
jgi:hypothetical protein